MKKATPPHEEWQHVWLAAREKDWNSLVLVPNDASVQILPFAEMLVTAGQVHGQRPVTVVNGTGVELGDVERTFDIIAATTARGERAVVPVDPLADNPAAIAILRKSSAALLIVSLGESLLGDAQRAIDIIGRDRLLGSVVVRPADPKT